MIKHTFKTFIFLYHFIKYKKSLGKSHNEQMAIKLESFIKAERGVFLKMCQYLGTNEKHHQIIKDLSFQKDELLNKESIQEIIMSSEVNFPEGTTVGDCIASASIGQVNSLNIENEELKVIKLKFPGLDKQIQFQQSLLKILPKKIIKKKLNVDIHEYSRMIEELLRKECDFFHEAKMHNKIYSLFPMNNHFVIPRIYKEYCCDLFIVSERLNPKVITNLKGTKNNYGENLAFTYLMLLKEGFTQGDSNHGNFLFLDDDKIGVIDFGQFYQFSDDFISSLVLLIRKLRSEEDFDDFLYYQSMGFKPEILELIRPHLRMLSLILFEPFILNKSFNLATWDYVSKINLILGQKKWLFRSAGGDEFFMIIKSFVGLKNLILKTGGLVNWYQVFDEVFNSFITTDLTINSEDQIYSSQARWVQILIEEDNGSSKVLRFSLAEIFQIENYLSSKVKLEMKSRGINLKEMCTEILKNGSSPCELLTLKVGVQRYSLSLV